jgi:hypothetical protein
MKPNKVSRRLIQNGNLKPTSIKTPKGGSRMAKRILMGSVAVTGILESFNRWFVDKLSRYAPRICAAEHTKPTG